ncbi:hypothetical protein [Desulfogranum mediterraneum]|uniref:hypothetical protein n=1 Tax=Desulfogranum mediterraneum TaxID=160661 RepID=UPI000412B8E1|nr:hypothetical protein [Desulfogranum mediterraneum]
MLSEKFVQQDPAAQEAYVRAHFSYRPDQGWFSREDEFCGTSVAEVIRALIDLEDAEINSIGDCMSGYCVTPPKLSDFVRKP